MDEESHWDLVTGDWIKKHRHTLWRIYSDTIHKALLLRWLTPSPVENALKTDLFDEAVSEGLYPPLQSMSKNVFGIDISSVSVAEVAARYPSFQVKVADVRSLPFAEAFFDAVVSNSTLDHFKSHGDIGTSLREIYRVLRPGGCLLLTLDNLANPAIRLRNALPFALLKALRVVPYFVGATFTPGGLKKALESQGFKIEAMGAVMHYPRILAVAGASIFQKCAGEKARKRYVDFLMSFEKLSSLPSRYLTGYFIAVKAVKVRGKS